MASMDDDRLLDLVRAARDWLRPELERSEPARRLAARLGQWLLDEASRAEREAAADAREPARAAEAPVAEVMPAPHLPDAGQPSDAPAGADETRPGAAAPEAASPAVVSPGPARRSARGPWTIGDLVGIDGDAQPPPADSSPAVEPAPEIDLSLVARRCRLKARSCRTVIARREAAADPVRLPAVIDRIDEQLAEAKSLRDCFLWALYRERVQPDDEALARIAVCYDALGAAAELVAHLEALDAPDRDDLEAAFQDLAEASSGLRIALRASWLTQPDRDQEDAHLWLRERTAERDVFVPRFMRLEDEADPAQAEELLARVVRRRTRVEDQQARQARERDGFRKLHYHAHRIEGEPGPGEEHDLRRIAGALAGLLEVGVRPTDRRLPAAIPPALAERALPFAEGDARAVLAALAAAPTADTAGDRAEEPDAGFRWSPAVEAVRALLEGRQVVLVGGEPRADAAERLEQAFGLSRAEWVRLTEHGSGEPLRAPISQAATALVLVLVKLVGHLHADEARALARTYGKACVSLPAGYNPEQVADAILKQASDQLRAVS